MKTRQKILIALFSALVLLTAVTLTGCFGDEEIDLYSELPDSLKGNWDVWVGGKSRIGQIP